MKAKLASIAILVLVVLAGCSRKVEDAVIFRINGQEVFKSEIELLGRNVLFAAGITPGTPEGQRHLQAHAENIYETLIKLYLVQQAAQVSQEEPSETDIDEAIETFKNDFPDPKEYEQFIETTGLSPEQVRDIFRNKILTDRFQAAKLKEAGENLTEEDLREWYEQNIADFQVPNRLRLRHILFAVSSGTTPEDRVKVREKAEHIRKNLTGANEETFIATAQEISEDKPTAPNGGDLGFVTLSSAQRAFPAGIADSVFRLKKGEISPVLQSSLGYHIFMVVDDKQEFKDAEDEVRKRMAIGSFAAWLTEAREKATIEIRIDADRIFAEPTPGPA
ncbi:MAG: peptidylprolyl isomerase [bacterium]